MAQDAHEGGRPPDALGGFIVMEENGYYGVDEELVERYGRAGDALYIHAAPQLW